MLASDAAICNFALFRNEKQIVVLYRRITIATSLIHDHSIMAQDAMTALCHASVFLFVKLMQ